MGMIKQIPILGPGTNIGKYVGGEVMYLQCFDEVKTITEELVKIPSIVNTKGEADCARWIYNYYSNLEYFKNKPELLVLQEINSIEIPRYNCISMVKGTKGSSNKTIILMGHFDTVGVDDFGSIKDYAFDPVKLPEYLRTLNLDDEIHNDIDSGDYMFGRGALDMKAGVAGHMYLVNYFSMHPEELDGNLICIAECDEEDNSTGIIGALKVLIEWKDKYDLEYIATINADYSTPYHSNDDNRYIYYGTIGKLLPSFYVVGKETHVGQAYGGLDPNLLVAELTRNIELNTDLCDIAQGEVTVPPISLRQTDTKRYYDVQTPLAAYSYYNFFTHSMNPSDVMVKMKEIGLKSFEDIIEYLNDSYKKYCEISGRDFVSLQWKPRVYTWEEFFNEISTIHGNKFKLFINNFANELNIANPSMDLREFSIKVIEESWNWSMDKSPAIIIFYSSVFFSKIEMTGEDELENQLMSSVEKSIDFVQDYCDKPITTKMFYPYISDASFMSINDDIYSLKSLARNMPAWGTRYNHPFEEILQINVPVVNIGTYGKDGHKLTERVHMKYSFENVPNITYRTIKDLLE